MDSIMRNNRNVWPANWRDQTRALNNSNPVRRILTWKASLATFLAVVIQHTASANNQWWVGPVYIEQTTALVLPVAQHQAGNIEVKIRNGFNLPAGAGCSDAYYITTLKTALDNNRGLFALLTTAQLTGQAVMLAITDDPLYTAFPGRCSLLAVSLLGG